MAVHANTPPRRPATELVREMKARIAPRRERVLRNAALLREIAAQPPRRRDS
jgi:hypothetical protein